MEYQREPYLAENAILDGAMCGQGNLSVALASIAASNHLVLIFSEL
jgi:hypothetical protein